MQNALTIFNEDYNTKFRTMYLEGKTIKEINETLEFNQGTFDGYYYLNKNGLRDFCNDCKSELFIRKTEAISSKIMAMDTDALSDKRLAIQQKEAEFIRESLGKNLYSKRIEQTGKDGATPQPIINITANVQDVQASQALTTPTNNGVIERIDE